MVSATPKVIEQPPTSAPAERSTQPIARANARISAYLIDSVVLFAFILASFVIAGVQILLTSDLGENDPPDSAYYAFIAILLGGPLLTWSAFNLALMRWRAQTTGMYVVGIRIVGEDSARLSKGQVLARWFAFHPLLFHPFLLPLWVIFALLVISLTLPQIVLVVGIALALLCIVSPVASLFTLLLDSERRAPHDRVAHTRVVHLKQP